MKKVLALLLAVLMVVGMAACSSKDDTSAPADTAAPVEPAPADAAPADAAPADADASGDVDVSSLKFGYVCMNLANPWFVEVQNGFEAACKELGVQCMIVDSQYDVDKQVSDIETLVNDGYNGIMISPIDQNALKSIVDTANDAGIITSCMAQSQDNTDFGYVCAEYEYGTMIGQNAANWINANLADKETVKVCLITQDNVEDTIARADGIQETLESQCPNVEIVARQAGDTAEGGLNIVEGVLAAHPDLDVVVASNDSGGVGGYQAMANAGYTADDPVAVFSGDATAEVIDIMKQGTTCYRGTVDLSPYKAAYDTAYKMVDMIKSGQKNAEQERLGFDMLIIPVDDVLSGAYVKGQS